MFGVLSTSSHPWAFVLNQRGGARDRVLFSFMFSLLLVPLPVLYLEGVWAVLGARLALNLAAKMIK